MVGIWILVAHLVGDYLLQSNKMSIMKTKSHYYAALHAAFYAVPYATVIGAYVENGYAALIAYGVIMGTHFLIDRYRLTTYISWLINGRGEKTPTGFAKEMPEGLALGLMIVVDNTVHLLINAAAIGVALQWN